MFHATFVARIESLSIHVIYRTRQQKSLRIAVSYDHIIIDSIPENTAALGERTRVLHGRFNAQTTE